MVFRRFYHHGDTENTENALRQSQIRALLEIALTGGKKEIIYHLSFQIFSFGHLRSLATYYMLAGK